MHIKMMDALPHACAPVRLTGEINGFKKREQEPVWWLKLANSLPTRTGILNGCQFVSLLCILNTAYISLFCVTITRHPRQGTLWRREVAYDWRFGSQHLHLTVTSHWQSLKAIQSLLWQSGSGPYVFCLSLSHFWESHRNQAWRLHPDDINWSSHLSSFQRLTFKY